jgi:hypothetical protein
MVDGLSSSSLCDSHSGHVLPCDRGASAQKDSTNCRPLLRAIGVVLLHRLQKGFQTEVRPHVYGIAIGLANVFIAFAQEVQD